jgi:hypothetical protein
LKESKELQVLGKIEVRSNIREICKEPEIELKCFAKKKEHAAPKLDRPLSSDYTGKKVDLLDAYLKQFKNKKIAILLSYIDPFYELVIRIYSNKYRFDFFKNNNDRLMTIRSRLISHLKTFLEKFSLYQTKHYIMIWDILRLLSTDTKTSDGKMLLDIINAESAKIVPEKYIYRLDKIKAYFAEAVKGVAIVDIGEEPKTNTASVREKLREGQEQYLPWSLDKFYEELMQIMSQCIEDKIDKMFEGDYIVGVDELMYLPKVDDYSREEALELCFKKTMEENDYGIDLWKKQKVLLYTIRDLGYLTEDLFNKFREMLYSTLQDIGKKQNIKIIEIKRSDILQEGMVEELLTSKCTKEEFKTFIEENEKIVQDSYNRMNELAKNIYQRSRAKDERYEELDKVIKR